MDSFSPEVLLALQALLSKELASRGVSSAAAPAKVAKAPKVSKEAKEATGEAKAKRAPGAWAAWTKHAPLAHAEEYAAFKASAVVKQGIAPLFCTQWRKDHAEEYAAFELAHKASPSAEPSVASPASAPSPASVASPAAPSPAAPSPAKEKRKWSEEAKANAAAKRAAKKAGASVASVVAEVAAVAASAPAPLPAAAPAPPASVVAANPFDEEDAEVELLPFNIGGRTYLRPGSSVAGSAPIWATGDLWESNKGFRGDWAGALQEDGSIDMDAEEPAFE